MSVDIALNKFLVSTRLAYSGNECQEGHLNGNSIL